MSSITDVILWIAIPVGILLCAGVITAFRLTRGRRSLTTESYHADAERAYSAAKAAAAHGGPAR